VVDLNLYPYRIQIKHKLTDVDKAKRVTMCQWFMDIVEDFLDNVWFSDEAHFTLYGHVNSKNNLFWGTSAPDEMLQRPLHSVRCTAWVAMSKHGIIGPIWFEDENENAVTVNKERYLVVLQQFWVTLGLRNRDIERNPFLRAEQCFQQDGATPTLLMSPLRGWMRSS